MVTVVAKFTLKEGKNEEFKEVAKELVHKSRQDRGCIAYSLNHDINEENVLSFIEQWESKESIIEHQKTEHFRILFAKLKKLQENNEEIEINMYEVIKFN